MIDFKCSCGKAIRVPDTLARKKVTCNQCGRKDIMLPGAGERLDLNDYELEGTEAGTIVLEPPNATNNLRPRKPVANQSVQAEKKPRQAVIPARGNKPVSEPKIQFEDEPARPSQKTSRLDSQKERPSQTREKSAPAEETAPKRPSRRERNKPVVEEPEEQQDPIEDENIDLDNESEAVAEKATEDVSPRNRRGGSKRQRLSADGSVSEEDLKETVSNLPAPKRDRSKRGDRKNRNEADSGATPKARRGRSGNDAEDLSSYKKSQRMIYFVIGGIIVVFIIAYLVLNNENKPKQTAAINQETAPAQKPEETKAEPAKPKTIAEPAYEKYTEVSNALIAKFNVTGANKESLVNAVEEKRKEAVKRKLSSKAYDTYIKEILEKKLAYALAFENILETAKPDKEDLVLVIYKLESLINASSNINNDKELTKDLPLDMNAAKVSWDKEKLNTYLEATKSLISSKYAEAEATTTRNDWKNILDIVNNGKVEDDVIDSPLIPQ